MKKRFSEDDIRRLDGNERNADILAKLLDEIEKVAPEYYYASETVTQADAMVDEIRFGVKKQSLKECMQTLARLGKLDDEFNMGDSTGFVDAYYAVEGVLSAIERKEGEDNDEKDNEVE